MGNLGIMGINEAPPPLDLSPEEIAALAAELVDYHAAFADLYYRKEQAHWGLKYLQGLMLPIERKSIEPMVLALDGGDVQAIQQFIGQGQWQDDRLLRQHWRLVDETVGEADGVYSVDGSDMPKQGEHAVGVARQWCGHVGKVDNCQAGVFAAYASRKGYTLLDRRLYLPEEWFDAPHRERWCKCSIPDATRFKTKQVLALEMVQASVTEGGPRFRWLTCDEAFGRDGAFLEGIAALERWYFAEVPHDTQVWLVPGAPGPQRVDQLAAAVPLDAWQPYLIKEGSPGPLVAEFALQRGVAVRAGLPGPDVWLVWRRGLGENPELKVYLSNAPTHTPVAALVRVAGMRWPIETAFEESVVMRSAKWRRCWPNATTRRLLRCRHRCNRV